ncbi:MAG: hypothetical protein ACM3H7_08415 [Acidobacteriaceae bacterium]
MKVGITGTAVVGVGVLVPVAVGVLVEVEVLVGVIVGVCVAEGTGVLVDVGGGKKGVFEGVGVVLMVGVGVMVGVSVIVAVNVVVGVWLGVVELVGGSIVVVRVGVWVVNTTGVKDETGVELPDVWPGRLGDNNTATIPAQ